MAPKTSPVGVSYGATADDAKLVSISAPGGDAVFGYSLKGAAKVPGVVEGGTVTYDEVFPGVDLELDTTSRGVKDSLVLASAKAGNSWVFPLHLRGLTIRPGEGGSFDLVDSAGEVAGYVPPGFAHDSYFDMKTGGFDQRTGVRIEVTDVLTAAVDKHVSVGLGANHPRPRE